MVSKSSLLVLASSILSSTAAWDPSTRDCNGHLCITSLIWCNNRDGGSVNDPSCYYPPNVWPLQDPDSVGPPAVLSYEASYNVSWTNHNEDFPITIRWNLSGANYSDRAQWEVNLTSKPTPSYYIFRPNEQNSSVTNLSSTEVLSLSEDVGNNIQIFQFEWLQKDKAYDEKVSPEQNALKLGYTDYTDRFIMQNGWAITWAKNWIERNNDNWEHWLKIGLGVGIGVGVPVMMAFTAALTWCCAGRQRYGPVKGGL